MSNWKEISQTMWTSLLGWARARREEGQTLQQIATTLGVKNRALVGEWLNENKKAENTSFALMMEYMEKAGFDYRDFFPDTGIGQASTRPNANTSSEENQKLRIQLEQMKTERDKALGQVELLKDLFASAQKAGQTGTVTQTVNGDQNKAVIKADSKG